MQTASRISCYFGCQVLVLLTIYETVWTHEGSNPYYRRSKPVVFTTLPSMLYIPTLEFLNFENKLACEVSIESIVSGWYPSLYWLHNDTKWNESWSNFWNMTEVLVKYPGSYQCVVDDGSFISVSPVVHVTVGGLFKNNVYTSVELYLGETANLTCETDIPIQFHPGRSWTQNNDLLINNGSEIVISKANLKNSRVYVCTDHNSFYFNNKKTVTFHVTVRNETYPVKEVEWRTRPVDQYVYLNEVAFFTCIARGSNITYVWLKDGTPVNESGIPYTIMAEGSVLQVNVKDAKAYGVYKCIAQNGYSRNESIALLHPKASVLISRWTRAMYGNEYEINDHHLDIDLEYDLEGKLSNTTEVPFNISGGPPPNVAWLHNGKPYIVPSNSLLFPSGLTAKQFVGMYQVFANNVHSNDSFTIRVLLKYKPNPPGVVTCKEVDNTSGISLSWQLSDFYPYLWKSFQRISWCNDNDPVSCNYTDLGPLINYTTEELQCSGRLIWQVYAFYDQDIVSESAVEYFSSSGNYSNSICNCQKDLVESSRNATCSLDVNGDFQCTFYWNKPSSWVGRVLLKNIDVFVACGNTQITKSFFTALLNKPYSLPVGGLPCNTMCKMSLVATGLGEMDDPLLFSNSTLLFSTGKKAPEYPPNVIHFTRNDTLKCSGRYFQVVMNVSESSCGQLKSFVVYINKTRVSNFSLEVHSNIVSQMIDLEYTYLTELIITISVTNEAGESEHSNSVSVPSLTASEMKDCLYLNCSSYLNRKRSDCDWTPLALFKIVKRIAEISYFMYSCSNSLQNVNCTTSGLHYILNSPNNNCTYTPTFHEKYDLMKFHSNTVCHTKPLCLVYNISLHGKYSLGVLEIPDSNESSKACNSKKDLGLKEHPDPHLTTDDIILITSALFLSAVLGVILSIIFVLCYCMKKKIKNLYKSRPPGLLLLGMSHPHSNTDLELDTPTPIDIPNHQQWLLNNCRLSTEELSESQLTQNHSGYQEPRGNINTARSRPLQLIGLSVDGDEAEHMVKVEEYSQEDEEISREFLNIDSCTEESTLADGPFQKNEDPLRIDCYSSCECQMQELLEPTREVGNVGCYPLAKNSLLKEIPYTLETTYCSAMTGNCSLSKLSQKCGKSEVYHQPSSLDITQKESLEYVTSFDFEPIGGLHCFTSSSIEQVSSNINFNTFQPCTTEAVKFPIDTCTSYDETLTLPSVTCSEHDHKKEDKSVAMRHKNSMSLTTKENSLFIPSLALYGSSSRQD